MKPTYYITTPIYYPSDKLHIGHTYTTVAADAIARYKRSKGFDVRFLTGTDEHGQKIERIATDKGTTPKAYVDEIVQGIKELWKTMDISNDIFIRTTDEKHEKAVAKIFKQLYDQGDIYKSSYEGKYCTPCESFFTETQLVNGNCPDCGRPVEVVNEESYFFKLSKYESQLIQYFEDNKDFVEPAGAYKEMMAFLKSGLQDLSVTRTSFKWGVPVEFDPGHVVYVWVDALSNYATALGYTSDDESEYNKFWPADVHLVGKEITRFHTIIWPALLMALKQPLPKKVFAHGWIVFDGEKMSKSIGNVVDPTVLVNRYGVDAVRYFIMRSIPFGQDGNFTNELLINRINFDLANDLGNLLSRTVGMIEKYFGGTLPKEMAETTLFQDDIVLQAETMIKSFEKYMDELAPHEALAAVWAFIARMNKYTDENEPWKLVKDESQKEVLAKVLYNLAEALRIVSILIEPFMPNTAPIIRKQLNMEKNYSWESASHFGTLKRDITITKGEPMFPRLELEKEMEYLQEFVKTEAEAVETEETSLPEITIDDFAKVELKVGTILECEPMKKSKKLLKFKVAVGKEVRQILSGIALHYAPEDLIGKQVVVVTNLPPRKMMGELSEGMILAAANADDTKLTVISPLAEIDHGAEVR